MEEEIYKMIYKTNCKITEDDIGDKVQVLYNNLKIYKETDESEFMQAFNYELSSFINNRKSLNDKIIRVLGNEFIRNNRNKIKFIIKNKKSKLVEYIDISNIKEDEIKIKLVLKDNISNKSFMFKDCESLIKLSIKTDRKINLEKISELKEDKDIDIEFNNYYLNNNQKNIDNIFYNCDFFDKDSSFSKTIENTEVSSKLSSFTSIYPEQIEIKKYKNLNLKYMFFNCLSLVSLPSEISEWNIDDTIDISGIFKNCISLKSLPDLSQWNTSNILDMNSIFHNCISLLSLPDLSKWNTDRVKDISSIFHNCISLKKLPDLSKWNTSNIIDINSIFFNCLSLESLPDLSKWNTSNVKDMNSIFVNCISLPILPDISKWDTKNVINMEDMYLGCWSLTFLPSIDNWDTKNVTNMCMMFLGCYNLKTLPDISKWDTSKVTSMNWMF